MEGRCWAASRVGDHAKSMSYKSGKLAKYYGKKGVWCFVNMLRVVHTAQILLGSQTSLSKITHFASIKQCLFFLFFFELRTKHRRGGEQAFILVVLCMFLGKSYRINETRKTLKKKLIPSWSTFLYSNFKFKCDFTHLHCESDLFPCSNIAFRLHCIYWFARGF